MHTPKNTRKKMTLSILQPLRARASPFFKCNMNAVSRCRAMEIDYSVKITVKIESQFFINLIPSDTVFSRAEYACIKQDEISLEIAIHYHESVQIAHLQLRSSIKSTWDSIMRLQHSLVTPSSSKALHSGVFSFNILSLILTSLVGFPDMDSPYLMHRSQYLSHRCEITWPQEKQRTGHIAMKYFYKKTVFFASLYHLFNNSLLSFSEVANAWSSLSRNRIRRSSSSSASLCFFNSCRF